MRISFLVTDAFGAHESTRALFSLAEALSRISSVEAEIVSVVRQVDDPAFRPGRLISFGFLVDLRDSGVRHSVARAGASLLVPGQDQQFRQFSTITDSGISRYAGRTHPDVLVPTSPGLAIALARSEPTRPMALLSRTAIDEMPAALADSLLDTAASTSAVATVTRSQAALWSQRLGSQVPVQWIPEPVLVPPVSPRTERALTVMAAGPLNMRSRFGDLIRAFAEVAQRHRDWDLVIYGRGPLLEALSELSEELGVNDRVTITPGGPQVAEARAENAIFVSTSEYEPSATPVVQAMASGMTVISADCPVGPLEELVDGTNALVYSIGDVPALSAHLDRAMSDESLRRRLSQAGQVHATAFAPDVVAGQFAAFLREAGIGDNLFASMGRRAKRALR